uniref:Protein tyrosine phosphatase non-receptor type 14 n=1 Tax=Ailuropoda melanoleuca TaxID=9646 RepID=A0A7N5KJ83_AILME
RPQGRRASSPGAPAPSFGAPPRRPAAAGACSVPSHRAAPSSLLSRPLAFPAAWALAAPESSAQLFLPQASGRSGRNTGAGCRAPPRSAAGPPGSGPRRPADAGRPPSPPTSPILPGLLAPAPLRRDSPELRWFSFSPCRCAGIAAETSLPFRLLRLLPSAPPPPATGINSLGNWGSAAAAAAVPRGTPGHGRGHVSSDPPECRAGHGHLSGHQEEHARWCPRRGTKLLRPFQGRGRRERKAAWEGRLAMPFGLKLRRTRRYNVLSKNCFVTRIRLLDSNVIECTLSVESTGQECLEAVAQRLELRETHYFGLWFLSKSQQARWVELEKPLKKHLDKFANEPLLFFGVMFYVPNVSWLQQEATRYQYYLQVKKDVLEGRLRCPLEQVIRLAGLAVQGKECDGRPVKSHFLFDCGAAGLSEGKNGIFLNDPLVTLTFHSKILEKCRSGKKKIKQK